MQSPDQFTLSVLDLTSDSLISSSQAHLVQLLRQTVEEHLPANDQESTRTFWTAQSQRVKRENLGVSCVKNFGIYTRPSPLN
jgi:hypothetical protein